jgi:DNA sulfur modification protein DndC
MKSSLKSTADPIQIVPVQPELALIVDGDGANGNDSSPATPVKTGASRVSAFTELGFQATIAALHEEIRALYTTDAAPWIIGYSGGKDSTATLQLVWGAIADLPPEQRRKTIHVISTDTLVENPIVAPGWRPPWR